MKVGICLGTLYPWQLNEMAVGLAETVKADSLWVPHHMLANFHPALWSSVGISDILEDPMPSSIHFAWLPRQGE